MRLFKQIRDPGAQILFSPREQDIARIASTTLICTPEADNRPTRLGRSSTKTKVVLEWWFPRDGVAITGAAITAGMANHGTRVNLATGGILPKCPFASADKCSRELAVSPISFWPGGGN